MLLRRRHIALLAGISLLGVGLCAQAVHSNVVVDSNPSVFAMLAGLNAAGYDTGVSAKNPIREAVRAQIAAHPSPAVTRLKAYYAVHHLPNRAQDLARYVTLALFLGNPPGLTLTITPEGLPPSAESVSDILPLLRDFWQQTDMDAVWQKIQPGYDAALQADAAQVRSTLTRVNAFFRIPQAYSPRQYFIFPDAMIAPGESDALNYEDNYYLVANLHLKSEMAQVRHTYLHFLLDPLIAQFPAAIDPVEQEILPLVANAPALHVQFKRNATLLYTECLVRAVEIELDPAAEAARDAEVQAAMGQGLVLTGLWYDQLTKFSTDPASFSEFYPQAAFALRIPDLAGKVKHLRFAPAPAVSVAAAAPEPIRAPSPMALAQKSFDQHDLATAAALAQTALRQPHQDHASAYYLLGKISALENHPQPAMTNFLLALQASSPGDHYLRTWANMYLARLYDAEKDRAHAVAHYKAALAVADTPASKALAEAGIKAPFLPPGRPH
ncbi:MAG: hypothetical protein EPN33_10900 [Acidobacteria bacterium]|nr:MAG: hypothetical protein EPN33_10900 [Acidobacteriota bacterium]